MGLGDFLIACDWISPINAILGDIMNGPSYGFTVAMGQSPLTGREIKKLLKRNGIKSWGFCEISFSGGTLTFSVKKRDATQATRVLTSAGIPMNTYYA